MINTDFKHLFFDLDDTLWDFKKNSALTFQHIFYKREIKVELNNFLKTYTPINEKYWKLYRNNQIDKSGLRFFRLADSFKALNMEISAEEINILADDFILHLADFNNLFPQTIETLDYLFPKYKLHILTNGFTEVQHRKLKKSGIYQYFETITASEEGGVKKPNPQIFKQALNKAKAEKTNSLMIGDNLEADIKGAASFGLKTIYFKALKTEDFNGIQIQSLEELRKYL